MTRISVVPFEERHVEAVGAMLAGRHARDRARAPELASWYEDAGAAREISQRTLAAPGMRAVVALRGDAVAGYLAGAVTLPEPGTLPASYVRPRSVVVEYAGHAAGEDAYHVYREMYAALVPLWLAAGCFSHYIHVPAEDREVCAALFSLGFGQESIYGVRITEPPPGSHPAGVTIRRAGADDLDLVTGMIVRLDRHHARSPFFRPYLPEHTNAVRVRHATMLPDPANAYWLAERGGHALGLHMYVIPDPAMETPDRCIHLIEAYTEPEARGLGLGTALLRHGLRHARDAGFTSCIVEWVSPNLSGSRFWLRSGFRPLTTWLVRHVDERATGNG
jgi:GNAT superfamily N-acetyltransferase